MKDEIIARALRSVEEKFVAASGPGGQNVNKVATAVQLRLDIYTLGLPPPVFRRLRTLAGTRLTKEGELLLSASEHRTQERNREAARERLVALLEQAFARPPRRARTRLNRVGKVKRLKTKKARGSIKAKRGRVDPGGDM